MTARKRLVYFGSGAFGLPTFERLAADHEIALVVTQPDRPSGRGRALTPTPIAVAAANRDLPILKPERVNDDPVREAIRKVAADAFIVIAFGQKLSQELLGSVFAINLHASLLPKFRGAAPINWAMIHNEPQTGVSVIGLADRMDAGDIYLQLSTPIDPMETAGELHDRLANLGPQAVVETLAAMQSGTLAAQPQDERLASRAPKLSRMDGTISFDQPATLVRARIHGVTPWPGCTVTLGEKPLRLHRVQAMETTARAGGIPSGALRDDLAIQCQTGALRILEVQPAGSIVMSFDAYCRGHNVRPGMEMKPA
jgi:methionyl-tRNA formyltransferase